MMQFQGDVESPEKNFVRQYFLSRACRKNPTVFEHQPHVEHIGAKRGYSAVSEQERLDKKRDCQCYGRSIRTKDNCDYSRACG